MERQNSAAAETRVGRVPAASSPTRGAVVLLLTMWGLMLFEPEWLVSSFVGGGSVLKRIPTLLLLPFLVVIALNWKPRSIIWPFLGYVLLHVVHLPIVENRGLMMGGFKMLYHFFFISIGTACIARNPKTMNRILALYAMSFLWHGLWGAAAGYVPWHSAYQNPDSFGPLMGVGVGYCFYFAQATRSTALKILAYAAMALALIGVVTSLARGAVLAVGIVLLMVWWHSPHKLRALTAGAVAAAFTAGAIAVIYPSGEFWEEMSTVTEGTSSGTGQERWVMWGIAMDVYAHHPIIGAGPNNVGPAAVRVTDFDEGRARYRDPNNLYNKKLHNIYVQVLSETGIVGIVLWAWMLLWFLRNVRLLRTPRAKRAWRRAGGADVDISLIARGLECAMVGYLANGIVYNQIYTNWFWCIITLAYVLVLCVESAPRQPPAPREPEPGATVASTGSGAASSDSSLGGSLLRG